MEDKLHILEDLNMLYIRQIALSLEGTDIQKKIDHEIRMREGACKLLAACTQREQALEATKSLLVCNSRILAYMAELQRMKEAQVMQHMARRPSDAGPTDDRLPCRGRVCISDIRIPLMWKDTEYFKNKGDLHRCAVFCLLQIGTEIYDTEMVLVDRTLTDICFENTILFTESGPDFELKVELYCAGLEEDAALGNTPKKLASRLSSSLGRSSGKRVRASLDGGVPGSPVSNGGSSPLLLPAPSVAGPKYQLLAGTTLRLADVQDAFRTHDLVITGHEESSFWLPLYGSVCCRLAAQPNCMVHQVMCGFLRVQQGEQLGWLRLFCVLRGATLLCYHHPQDVEAQVEPSFTITVSKETRIRASERDPKRRLQSMLVTNRYGGEEVTHTLQAENRAETQRWMEAFWQHFYDMSQWKHCCDELMKVETPSPRRPAAPLPKQGSLYHETAIEPVDDIEAVTEILARRVSGLGSPVWLSLFEGPGSPPTGASDSDSNSSTSPRPLRPPWGRPRTLSLDAKLSTLNGRSGRPPPPRTRGPSHSSSSSSGSGSPTPEPTRPPCPQPHPTFDPRLWLQSQV
ncbi:rhotekin isoform X3 [Eublepharis macularius]|uniref:Rhotekin isoform X3 n=1 Tax=Eublepharis macularius TaxID=481883 RepID=A0AA97JWW4_EUBMA|nr:rhotekin isoform X3 [Eublepharis macularius]XP_054845776.1 rhotekin isoform X3 [Eublepharis macularius]XP_054845777.1 rhotekin isoform X3 [Eublepharis macularius]